MDFWLHEKEFDQQYAEGKIPPIEWRDRWWTERAKAMHKMSLLQEQVNELHAYIGRCTARIESVLDGGASR